MATLEAAIKSAMLRYGLIGKSPLYLAAMEQALKVAPVDLSVLIIGESGSGKEVFPESFTTTADASTRNTWR